MSDVRPRMLARATPGLLLGRPGGQENSDTYVLAPMEVGVALVVEAVGQTRFSKPCPISGPECLPGLLLRGPGGQELPDAYAIAPTEVGVALVLLKMVDQARAPKQCPTSGPECLPGLLLGRPGGQEHSDTYVIAPMEVGVALVVEAVGQTRISKPCPMSGPECLPGLLLGGPDK